MKETNDQKVIDGLSERMNKSHVMLNTYLLSGNTGILIYLFNSIDKIKLTVNKGILFLFVLVVIGNVALTLLQLYLAHFSYEKEISWWLEISKKESNNSKLGSLYKAINTLSLQSKRTERLQIIATIVIFICLIFVFLNLIFN
ncbi:MAG: hypothetical protein WBG30_08440 [Psychrilyobacter sp.]|uniref:hypothetical protein n=1 Tax=Psychrilyobacter sp. TaxID=2586924 RepID=UPI003C76881B